ncbi:hypothetical protein C8Q80DRAFT_564478 [Daedaleopsis nitida]|nr:hypothetical protein C8Q80DRAFT_564478 [Daedaleopsis nitida]
MSSHSSNSSSSSSRSAMQFDPSLLQPIVRSKRTPIACTECRRRQVKCSGTTPRCERCQKKNIECTYMSLSEQRASSTTGSGSRSGTPVSPALGHSHAARVAQAPASWQAGSQGFSTGTSFPAPQGWRAESAQGSSISHFGGHAAQNQSYAGASVAYPQGYTAPAGYAQGGSTTQAGGAMYAQGYAQQGYANGSSYEAYGPSVAGTDPGYAYSAAQMGSISGGQPSSTYVGQYSQQQQMLFDPTTGQMMPVNVATQWADSSSAGYQAQSYSSQN